MAWTDGRARSVIKKVTFTPKEWASISEKVLRKFGVQVGGWNEFARSSVLKKEISVIEIPFDPDKMEVQVNKIGVNVNQIAHRVNAQDYATLEEVKAVHKALDEINKQLTECWELYRNNRKR
ncbi:MobC family plasmid mobilization relaxosome protein [Bifidobacterium aquikefiri]|uniref:MobC family plasmid mobilization relaxosome protein n=1 Tax=Bifidobacterium aquikefiri TaxID=1653207 RepID=UPI0039E9CCF9